MPKQKRNEFKKEIQDLQSLHGRTTRFILAQMGMYRQNYSARFKQQNWNEKQKEALKELGI